MRKIKGLECILLVDDDKPINYVHRKIIETAKIETHVQSTTSGPEALEYLTSTGRYAYKASCPQPGIIFLDINMPGMDGWAFLEDYKKLDDLQKAKVIVVMLTTSINPDDSRRAEVNTEIKAFLKKPLSIGVIKQLVEDNFYV